MTLLLQVHSILRFGVLLSGLTLVAMCLAGLMQGLPYTRAARVVGAVFSGVLQLQVLVGLGLLALWPWVPRNLGHLLPMLAAVVLAMVMLRKNRKAAQPNWVRPLIGAGGALVLAAVGVLAIGRTPWAITAFGG